MTSPLFKSHSFDLVSVFSHTFPVLVSNPPAEMRFLVAALFAALATADIYMHFPRGSNNRLNEANRERNNGNRLFNSQNNNRGGVNGLCLW